MANGRSRKKSADPIPDPPEWLPRKIWDEWVEHRRQKRKAITPLSASKTFEVLAKAKASGHNPVELIEKAIASGWQGVFIPDTPAGRSSTDPRPKPAEEFYVAPDDAAAEWGYEPKGKRVNP